MDMYSYTEDLIFTSANTHISSAKISLNGKKKKNWTKEKKKAKTKTTCTAEMLTSTNLFPI